ncbi:MAG TPA: 5-(carboxyamino)imidazole ribonucleotide synthase [Steroidobacteraceae bacterium]|nr:5-(carboxyamino)imidazole ribonucleotide synthase [Steroidobacteraceae bacterium]
MKSLRVGIVGAGQLGRMMALAGYPLGIRCSFLDRSSDAPAAQVAPILTGALEDPGLLRELASKSDVLTFDWENISSQALAPLESLTEVRPPRAALEVSQDRLHEKALFKRLRIPVAEHAPVDSLEDLARAARKLGVPGVLKTRRMGYDGKGQFVIRCREDLGAAWESIGAPALIYEKFQSFSREISIVAARSASGEFVYYPLSANTHGGGILRYGLAPYANRALERTARIYMKRVLTALGYTGVLAIEFFVVGGRLIANEMAPRVHNSGHWTIEGCVTSQFENHLRAICGLPLGSTRPLGHTAMINFLGQMPDRERLLAIEGLAFHDYGKEPRPGRKLGHCTILRATARDRDRALADALESVEWS